MQQFNDFCFTFVAWHLCRQACIASLMPVVCDSQFGVYEGKLGPVLPVLDERLLPALLWDLLTASSCPAGALRAGREVQTAAFRFE